MESDKVSFNILKKIEELKAKEKQEMKKHYPNLNIPRNILGRKMINMLKLKANEEQFEDVSFNTEEREAIVNSEEIRRSHYNKQSYILPLAIVSTVGFMAVTKRCMRIDTFLANINLLAGVFAGTYFVSNVFLNFAYWTKSRNYNNVLQNVYGKAKCHAECVSLISDLKFDEDYNLE
jgi:hypothetical protein